MQRTVYMCKETGRDLDPEKHRGSVTVKIMVFILKKNLGIVTQDTDSNKSDYISLWAFSS